MGSNGIAFSFSLVCLEMVTIAVANFALATNELKMQTNEIAKWKPLIFLTFSSYFSRAQWAPWFLIHAANSLNFNSSLRILYRANCFQFRLSLSFRFSFYAENWSRTSNASIFRLIHSAFHLPLCDGIFFWRECMRRMDFYFFYCT